MCTGLRVRNLKKQSIHLDYDKVLATHSIESYVTDKEAFKKAMVSWNVEKVVNLALSMTRWFPLVVFRQFVWDPGLPVFIPSALPEGTGLRRFTMVIYTPLIFWGTAASCYCTVFYMILCLTTPFILEGIHGQLK
jgi:hypothetical protein